MYLQLAEGNNLSQNDLYLQENGMYLQEEGSDSSYLYIPGELGQEGVYVREDYFDDLPFDEWNEVMDFVEESGPELSFFGAKARARRAARREARNQRKMQRIAARGAAGTGIAGAFKGIGRAIGGVMGRPAPAMPADILPAGHPGVRQVPTPPMKTMMQKAMPWVLVGGGALLLMGLMRRRKRRS